MTKLTPAAQAVYDAVLELCPAPADEIAAALRAAADQEQENPWSGRIESVGAMWMRDRLLAIAAELEGSGD